MGLELNELADATAGSAFPRFNPKPCITTSSQHCSFQNQAVVDWHTQSLLLIDQQCICLKGKHKWLLPQLWGKKVHQLYDLVQNDIHIFGWFTRLILGHAPIGSYRQQFFPLQNALCPMDN